MQKALGSSSLAEVGELKVFELLQAKPLSNKQEKKDKEGYKNEQWRKK